VRKSPSAWYCTETPQKVVKRAEVLHGEFPYEGRYGVLQEHCARCGEHNVINIKQQLYCIYAVVEDEQGGVRLGLNKPKVRRYVANRLYQARGACFSP
jgi:hypothetical protein